MARETKKQKAQPIRALLVDDNYDFYQALSMSLPEEAISIEYAGDGFSAFQLIKQRTFDVVISDVHMPHINGLTLLEEFSKKNIRIPFIMVTGNLTDRIARDALQMGAYNLLEKPFPPETLLEKCRVAMALHREEDPVSLGDQERAYIYNSLKLHYYDVDRIMRSIQHYGLSLQTISVELEKKTATGKCAFDDLQTLKYLQKT